MMIATRKSPGRNRGDEVLPVAKSAVWTFAAEFVVVARPLREEIVPSISGCFEHPIAAEAAARHADAL